MTYEQFIEQVKWEVEDIARESFDDVRTVVRTVTKNNNVRRKTISIFKEGQLATPTIYLRDYYLDYKKGRSIENIGREIFMIYSEGTKRFTFDVNQFSDFSKVKDKIYYKLVNYEMNRQALKTMPHFKFLDMAIVFFVSIMVNEKEQGTIAIQNAYTSEDDDENGLISEEISYGEFSIDNVRQMIKEEVDKMRAQAEMDMYVLTNTSRNFGAACITYPGVLKEFAREHNSDFYIIPSSVHEVILILGEQMSVEEMNLMVEEVNEREVDSIDVLSNHVYQYKRELEEIIY